jgi:hypothetical protein
LSTEKLALVYGAFPEALNLGLLSGDAASVLVSTNVTHSYMVDNITNIYRSLRLFDHLIIDITRFGEARDEQSQVGLLAELQRDGFVEVAKVHQTSGSPDIRHFQRQGRDDQKGGSPKPGAVEELRLSDIANLVPSKLQTQPFLIFEGTEVVAEKIFPRLAHVPRSWLPASPIRINTFRSPFSSTLSPLAAPIFEPASSSSLGTFIFGRFGGHRVQCDFGVFKCLLLDPSWNRDRRALEIFRFVAENVVHSCADKSLILPWAERPQYIRPDLMLHKLFLSDQALGLHCDHVAQIVAYLLHMSGYRVREIAVVDPAVDSGHIVMEVFLPDQGSWAMLDADFGVVVADRQGRLIGTEEIIACRDRSGELVVESVVAKRWSAQQFDVGEPFSGQLSSDVAQPLGELAVSGDSYYQMMDRVFLKRRTIAYRFEDGFEDNRGDPEDRQADVA